METATVTPRTTATAGTNLLPGAPSLPGKAAEARERLRHGDLLTLLVDGDCMNPTLRRGATVLVHRRRSPRVGDVALLEAQGWLEIHRLVARIDSGPRSWFVHLGDASTEAGLASEDEVLGVVATGARRRLPAARAHAWGLFLRLGALLDRLGLGALRAIFVESSRKSG